MLLQKKPRLVIGFVMFSIFFIITSLFEFIPENPDPEVSILAFISMFGVITCAFAYEDDKRIRAELDELRKLVNPPETEEA